MATRARIGATTAKKIADRAMIGTVITSTTPARKARKPESSVRVPVRLLLK